MNAAEHIQVYNNNASWYHYLTSVCVCVCVYELHVKT